MFATEAEEGPTTGTAGRGGAGGLAGVVSGVTAPGAGMNTLPPPGSAGVAACLGDTDARGAESRAATAPVAARDDAAHACASTCACWTCHDVAGCKPPEREPGARGLGASHGDCGMQGPPPTTPGSPIPGGSPALRPPPQPLDWSTPFTPCACQVACGVWPTKGDATATWGCPSQSCEDRSLASLSEPSPATPPVPDTVQPSARGTRFATSDSPGAEFAAVLAPDTDPARVLGRGRGGWGGEPCPTARGPVRWAGTCISARPPGGRACKRAGNDAAATGRPSTELRGTTSGRLGSDKPPTLPGATTVDPGGGNIGGGTGGAGGIGGAGPCDNDGAKPWWGSPRAVGCGDGRDAANRKAGATTSSTSG